MPSIRSPAPSISVLINNYNYGRFLRRALDSALAERTASTEIIVVDDGSTDDSRTILAGYQGREGVQLLLKENGGQASSFNAGFAASTGKIVCLLDSDDYFLPGKLARLATIYGDHPDIGWCYHDLEVRSESGSHRDLGLRTSRRADVRWQFWAGSPRVKFPATSGLTFRRSLLGRLLPMPEGRNVSLGDHYLKFGAAILTPGFLLADALTVQTVHGSNFYTGARSEQLKAEIFVRTGAELRRRLPHASRFADNLAGTARAIRARSADPNSAVDELIREYLRDSTAAGRIRVWLWDRVKRRKFRR